jgi:ribosomal protein S18 acetylase RimI-like enzyme
MIKICEWESKLLKFNIAQLFLINNHITPTDISDYINQHKITLLKVLVKVNDFHNIKFLEKNKFSFSSQKVTLTTLIKKKHYQINPDLFKTSTIDNIKKIEIIAKKVFESSRFFTPPFTKKNGELLYSNWAKNAILKKYDDICIHHQTTDINGFITLKKQKPTMATIGLLGVKKELQGQKIGKSLLYKIFNYCQINNISELQVCTESHNINALNFYINFGFKIKHIKNWYYLY